MEVLRRRLRLWVGAWLLCQAASLSAFVPACCRADQAAMQPQAANCEAASECPMRTAEGAPCPMHATEGEAADHEAVRRCLLTGDCDGTPPSLSAVLAVQGVLADTMSFVGPRFDSATTPLIGRSSLVSRNTAPDPPPPRA